MRKKLLAVVFAGALLGGAALPGVALAKHPGTGESGVSVGSVADQADVADGAQANGDLGSSAADKSH